MKKNLLYSALSLLILTIGFYSCQPDNTNNDPAPIVDPREQFVGYWNCTEQSKIHGTASFTINIYKDSTNTSYIRLTNFYQLGQDQVISGLTAGNNITVNAQTICSCVINGTGNLQTSTKINWNYTVNDLADIDTCTAVFTKQ